MTSEPPLIRPENTSLGVPARPSEPVLSLTEPYLTSVIALRSTAACSGMITSTEPQLASSSMRTVGLVTSASVKSSFVEPYLLRTTTSGGTSQRPLRTIEEYCADSSSRLSGDDV